MDRILIVDNDEGLIHFLTKLFVKQGYDVVSSTSGGAALEQIAAEPFDLILLDYKMPGLNGFETLAAIRRAQVKTPVVIMTAYGTTETAIEAMKLGAYDYLLKPFDTEDLKRIAGDALEVNRLIKEVVRLPGGVAEVSPGHRAALTIVGTSRPMQEVFKRIGQVAEKDVTVLITGESGTGKELVARAIYHHSRRKGAPFMAVNCASIPDTLFESELFGYERGAFTGADRTYLGKFERCHGGTIFFDEIGDMSLSTQAKVLRVLQEGEFERLGSTETIKVNVRILAATNKNLEREVEARRFREDLYYRLRIIAIELPPLRRRLDDVPQLVDYFLGRFAEEYAKPVHYVSHRALEKLRSYGWPGNVRELENCLRRAILMGKGDVLLPEDFEFESAREEEPAGPSGEGRAASIAREIEGLLPSIVRPGEPAPFNIVELVERTLIEQTLRACGNNQVHAARALGVSRNMLRHRLKKYGPATTPDGGGDI